MTWVAEIYRAHPNEFLATLRETFGVALADLGGSLLDGELVALVQVAVADPSTRLGAKVQKWAYRATIPEVIHVSSLVDKQNRDQALPWGMWSAEQDRVSRRVSPAEVAEGRARLSAVSAFRRVEGFDG